MRLATALVAVLSCLALPPGGEATPVRRAGQAKPMTAFNWNEAFEPLRFGRRSPPSADDATDSDPWLDLGSAPQPRFTVPPQREQLARMLLPAAPREDPTEHLSRAEVVQLIGDLIHARQQSMLDN